MPGTWQTIHPKNEPLNRHENAFVEVDDRFYLVGGRGEKPVEVYDPAANTWTTGAMPPIEMHHFQGVEYDGKIYVLGAFTGGWPDEPPIPNIYIYDPATDSWTTGPEIPADRRRGVAGAVVHEGRIHIAVGSRMHSATEINSQEVYTPGE